MPYCNMPHASRLHGATASTLDLAVQAASPRQIVNQAVDMGILQRPTHKPLLYHSIFPVPKSDGLTSRLISDPPEINLAMKRIWPCHFTALPDLVRTVCTWSYAVQYDAKSFYFQFPLGQGVARWFGVRFQHSHSAWCPQMLQLSLMPQGWGPSAPIAQETSRLLIYQLPAIAHIQSYFFRTYS